MTLYLTDTHDSRRDRPCGGERIRPRREVLPGRQHDAFGRRRHLAGALLGRARAHGGTGRRAAASRRGDGRRHRSLRPRERLHRAGARARSSSAIPRLRIVLEHVTTRAGGRVRARGGRPGRRDDHAAAPAAEPRRDVQGGLRPHLYCLPVLKRERDREALIEAATSGNRAVLPRHRQRPAREAGQGIVLRLRRHLLGARRRSSCMRRRSSRRAGSIASRHSPSFHGADFYGLPRNTGDDRSRAAGVDRAGELPVRRGRSRADGRGRAARVEAAGRCIAMSAAVTAMRDRFRGFLPVVVDVETGGFIAATRRASRDCGRGAAHRRRRALVRGPTHRQHVRPFEGGRLDPPRSRSTASIPGIRCGSPRPRAMRSARSSARCAAPCASSSARAPSSSATTRHSTSASSTRAVARAGIRRNPFHPFS